MLEKWCPVSGLFQLVLGVRSKLTPDIINKGLRISKVFMEEGFKFWQRDWSGALVAVLVLSSSEAYSATEKWGCKWGTIYPNGAWSFKIVFTLLTKVIAIYVRFHRISLWGSSFKWLFLRLCLLLLPSLNWLHKYLKKFCKEVLGRGNKR